jgi:hypothetical protein
MLVEFRLRVWVAGLVEEFMFVYDGRCADTLLIKCPSNAPLTLHFCSAQVARARQKHFAVEKKRASLVQSGLLDEARRNVGMGGRHSFLRLLHVGIGRAPVQQSALRPERPAKELSPLSLCFAALSPLLC